MLFKIWEAYYAAMNKALDYLLIVSGIKNLQTGYCSCMFSFILKH
jgi:hypothetical protein